MPTSATAAPGRLARRALPHLALLGLALGIALVNGGAGSTAEAATLEGAPWRLETYTGPDGQTRRALPGSEITATFQAGRMSGSAGCNSYSAGFALGGGGGAIVVSPPASTRMFCASPPGVMEQEAAYLAALPTAVRYRIEGERLSLETADGARVATYVARGAPGPVAGVPRVAPPVPGLPRTGAGPGEDPSAPADDLEE